MWSAKEVGQIYQNITSTKIKKNIRYPSINKIFLLFAALGFRIAEYNDRPMIKKKKKKMGWGVCPGKWTQIPENEVHCPGEKIMACITL